MRYHIKSFLWTGNNTFKGMVIEEVRRENMPWVSRNDFAFATMILCLTYDL